jgi:hypothetical protein
MLFKSSDAPTGPSVDVVFRPDPAPALLLSPDITRYWNGTITLTDVPFTGTSPFRAAPLPPARPVPTPRLWDGIQWEQRRQTSEGRATF